MSSAPRSRGLLPGAAAGDGQPGLGPALAGVALAAGGAAIQPTARPRARGGCSGVYPEAGLQMSSAPRSRGLLPGAAAGDGQPGLGPALAGVARVSRSWPGSDSSRPRARGGCSRPGAPAAGAESSAPRSRGLLFCHTDGIFAGHLGPALTGVAPRRGGRTSCGRARPRARGGCSAVDRLTTLVGDSAPRSRGLLAGHDPGRGQGVLGPALAGVALARRHAQGPAAARPRARGGCSRWTGLTGARPGSAPRSRGLLFWACRSARPIPLGPALAGVALGRVGAGRPAPARPRARGGCSPSPTAARCSWPSAPRSRGLLDRPRRDRRHPELGPALAGVAQRARPIHPVDRTRPRARGGCSDEGLALSRATGSAPRSRGLLRTRARAATPPTLGPALAGVALRTE